MIERPDNAVQVLDGQGWISLKRVDGSEQDVVSAARVSVGREDRGMDAADVDLLGHMLSERHMTPFEFVNLTFVVKCPLFVRAQWFRHRTMSYVEQSRRYTKTNFEFYVPAAGVEGRALVEASHAACEKAYVGLLAGGMLPEQARGVLPQNTMTTFQCRADLRNLLEFLALRDSGHAQMEIRVYAQAIKKLLAPCFPHIFKGN